MDRPRLGAGSEGSVEGHLSSPPPARHHGGSEGLGGSLGLLETEGLGLRGRTVDAGHPSLARAAKATVHRILAAQPLHPERVTYYLEHRDPNFEAKMREVLMVYQEVALQNGTPNPEGVAPQVVTVSVDEKPGLQAIANTAPDLPPVPGKHPTVARDHEYQRLGT